MPIISSVNAIIHDKAAPTDVVRELMGRSLKME
jgi:glycerol-3-phosphate dehydrogenase